MRRVINAVALSLPALGAAAAMLCAPLPAAAQRPAVASVIVRAENPLQIARADETIVVAWTTLQQHMPTVQPASVRAVDVGTGAELPTQIIDENGDGQPEELLVSASFWPGEAKELRIEATPPTSKPKVRAYAKHDAHRDDVAWETDRIAFRIYGQGLWNAPEFQPLVSSGIDIWPKRVRELIVDKWYAKGHDAYHVDTGEGADFYTVGPTLGAGGSAVWRDDKLHHAKNFKAYRIVASGPIRLIFELDYEPWDAGDMQVSERKRITMDAGQNLFRQDITYRLEAGGNNRAVSSVAGKAEITYAVGTVKRAQLVGSSSRAQAWAWLSTWGPVELKNGGHGSLGTAVLMERGRVVDVKETDDHYIMLARAKPGQSATQYVGAGWTASGDFADAESWWSYLNTFARRLEQPIKLSFRAATAPAPDGT